MEELQRLEERIARFKGLRERVINNNIEDNDRKNIVVLTNEEITRIKLEIKSIENNLQKYGVDQKSNQVEVLKQRILILEKLIARVEKSDIKDFDRKDIVILIDEEIVRLNQQKINIENDIQVYNKKAL